MLAERRIADEIMDDPALDAGTYASVLHDLQRVNRLTRAYAPTLGFLEKAAAGRTSLSVLDVGFGHGDTLRRIARWAKDNALPVTLVGIDLNTRSEAIARASTPAELEIDFRTGDYADLAGAGFDCITSSLVAHHMARSELVDFLRFMHAEAQVAWFVNDLHRHGLSYLGYPLLARLMGWHRIVRLDGQTSIARSFRPADWRDLLGAAKISGASVARHFPFRLCVSHLH